MVNLDNVKHIKDKFFDTKGEVVKIEDSKGVLWKKQDTPPVEDRLKGTWLLKLNESLDNSIITKTVSASLKGSYSCVESSHNQEITEDINSILFKQQPVPVLNGFSIYAIKEGHSITFIPSTWAVQAGSYPVPINIDKPAILTIDTTYNDLVIDDNSITKEEFIEWLGYFATKIS